MTAQDECCTGCTVDGGGKKRWLSGVRFADFSSICGGFF
jgi:hypothetical protein